MKIEILIQAKEDLFDGYLFYERQEQGVGDYFLDSLSADIDSRLIHHGYHRQLFGFHRMIARVFPFSFIIELQGMSFSSMPWWTNARIPHRSSVCFNASNAVCE